MAETSEFLTDLPQSAYLSSSMRRAISAAQQRSHRYVTLEHLLLALLDDPDAIAILEAVRADIPAIRASITDTVNRNLATLYTPGQFDLRASYKVERVLQTASDDASRLGCHEVDAAFVLSALARESDNPAADILRRNGFSYPSAMTWLYANRGTSPSSRASAAKPQPQPEPAPAAEAAPAEAQPAPAAEPEPRASPHAEAAAEEAESEDDEEADELDLEIVEDHEPVPVPKILRQRPTTPVLGRTAQSTAAAGRSPPVPPAPGKLAPPIYKADVEEEDEADPWSLKDARPPAILMPRRREPAEGARTSEVLRPAGPSRAEPQLPPASRIEGMRVGSGGRSFPAPAPAPAPPPPPAKGRGTQRPAAAPGKAAAPDKQKGARPRRPRPYEALMGRLIENIPRRMRAETPERIEVRISREETQAISRGMEGRADPVRHDVRVTQTMSVALRAPDGGFTIEPLSPETQWIFDRPESADSETYGRWRWVVTPHETGQRRLQLIVAARSIGQNGLVGDSALPDQIITVRVRTNYWRSAARGLQWIAAMVIGGVLTEFAIMGMRMFGVGE